MTPFSRRCLVGMSGGAVQPSRSGRHHIALAPLGIFKGRQGHVLIGPVSEDMWQRLAQAMGRADLITDERYRHNDGRRARRDELTRLIEEWLQALPDDGTALDILQRARVPCAPILSVAQAMAHPHLIGRGMIGAATDPVWGEVKMPGPLVRFAGQAGAKLAPAPFLGEHNAAILGSWREMPERETVSLGSAGVLVRESVGRAA
jgi:crotonobetainyl-CoA:carnitine CoA-transferase CaiB-like acyl-CoA transferase